MPVKQTDRFRQDMNLILTYAQYRLLVKLATSYVYERPTSRPAKILVKLGLAVWGKDRCLYITKAGRDRI